MEGFYEGLSEHCHPNAPAMVLLYTSKHDVGVSHYTDENEGRARVSTILALGAFIAALDVLEWAHTVWDELGEDFVTLAEMKTFEKWKWPEGLEFPIKRGTAYSLLRLEVPRLALPHDHKSPGHCQVEALAGRVGR